MQMLVRAKEFWRRWPWKWPTLLILVVVIIGLIGLSMNRTGQEEAAPEEVAQRVSVRPFARLLEDTSVTKTAVVEPAVSAPLVARLGGRVTSVSFGLGDTVPAGTVVVQIDGDTVANPSAAQAAGAAQALSLFDAIEAATLASAENAVAIAQLAAEAAAQRRPLTEENAALARRLADTSVAGTRLALEDARDAGVDALIRTADLADQAAQFTQDQATVSRNVANLSANEAARQAQLSLHQAQLAQERTIAELATQRAQLATAARVAAEQVKLQHVTAPVNGVVTRLTVRVGEYVNPGHIIGEVNALAGAVLTLDVSTAVRQQLAVGQVLPIVARSQEFSGEVSRLAAAPASRTGLWQVEVIVTSTPDTLEPNDSVTVLLPSSPSQAGTVFLPLDALTIRQSGPIIFTTTDANTAVEHVVEVVGFDGDLVEARVDLAPDDHVVVSGNRTLRNGDRVIAD